jgi:hypothetical protein
MELSLTANTNIGEAMTKQANKKNKKQVRDVKGQEKKPDGIQVVPGNIGTIQVQLLAAILAELRKVNERP